MWELYGIPTQKKAKHMTNSKAKLGMLTYTDIALEELCEAVSEFDARARYAEVIQLAAVCLNWAAKIRRIDLQK